MTSLFTIFCLLIMLHHHVYTIHATSSAMQIDQGSAELEPQLEPLNPSNQTNSQWVEQQNNLASIALQTQLIQHLQRPITRLELISAFCKHRTVTTYWAKVRIDQEQFCQIKYFIPMPKPSDGVFPPAKLEKYQTIYPINQTTPIYIN
eukprot:2144_1